MLPNLLDFIKFKGLWDRNTKCDQKKNQDLQRQPQGAIRFVLKMLSGSKITIISEILILINSFRKLKLYKKNEVGTWAQRKKEQV